VRRARLLVLAAAAAVTLTAGACSSQSLEASPVETRPAPSPVPAASATPNPTASNLEQVDPPPAPSPTWDTDSRDAAVEHAAAVMAAFARPEADERSWWAELAPLLTLSAQDAYAFVDPANVPARQVTGAPVLVDESSAWLARVEVPTDVGTYDLLLVRDDGASPWLAEQITPPAALSEPTGLQPATSEDPATPEDAGA